MIRPVPVAAIVLAILVLGCRDGDGKSAVTQQSAIARAQCEREAQEIEPPGAQGTLVGAYEVTLNAVKREYQRLYDKKWPGLADGTDRSLALCYYDVPPEVSAVAAPGAKGPIERIFHSGR